MATSKYQDNYTYTLNVTLAGETREVRFTDFDYSEEVFAAQIGRGNKMHRAGISVWKFDSADEANKKGFRFNKNNLVESDNVFYGLRFTTTIRNRNNAIVVDWADKYEGSESATKQKYYASL